MTVTEVISKKSDVVSKRAKHENLVIQKCFFCKSTNKKNIKNTNTFAIKTTKAWKPVLLIYQDLIYFSLKKNENSVLKQDSQQ